MLKKISSANFQILLWSKEVLVTLCFIVLSFISTCYTSTGRLITANLLNDRQGMIWILSPHFRVPDSLFPVLCSGINKPRQMQEKKEQEI